MSVYLDRYASPSLLISTKPELNTGLIVVIPVFKEKNTIATLNSLLKSKLPSTSVEVLIIINQPLDCDDLISKQNTKSFEEIEAWIKLNQKSGIVFYVQQVQLPTKHAGVGLARKAGMDEAVRRFESIENEQGIILCFDADCLCSTNYLDEVYSQFDKRKLKGASIYFEHKTESLSQNSRSGISQYELHLRYYVNGLRNAGYPYSFHTVGSSMAVRTDIYKKSGGMNKRKAGEDFHYLHKVIPYGHFGDITSATVYPSTRISDRVPFGTGKAMGDWKRQNKSTLNSYHPAIFQDLACLLKSVPKFHNSSSLITDIQQLPSSIQSYLIKENFESVISSIDRKSPTHSTFLQHWFAWFNGLKVLHLVHYLRDNFYPSIPVTEAASQLMNYSELSLEKILDQFREMDKNFKADQISLKHLYSEYL